MSDGFNTGADWRFFYSHGLSMNINLLSDSID